MFEEKVIGAILLMGGMGSRFGSPTPKQFHPLLGKEVYRHALDTMQRSTLFDEIVLVIPSGIKDLHHEGITIVEGGNTRQQSSLLGLQAFKKTIDIVLIHDAVRPFVSERILKENVASALQWGAVDTCIPTADTLVHAPNGKIISSIPRREEFMRGQTPQTFRFDWILQAHEKALAQGIKNASDDCQLILRDNRAVHIVLGDEKNFKITTEFDLLMASSMSHLECCSYK